MTQTFRTTDAQQMANLVNTVARDAHYEYLGMTTERSGLFGLTVTFVVCYRFRPTEGKQNDQ